MAYDKIDQLYDALKKDGAVSKSRENFRGKMLAPGKEGYKNRLQLYNALKADGAVESPTYEEFGKRLGLHAVRTASPLTPPPPRGGDDVVKPYPQQGARGTGGPRDGGLQASPSTGTVGTRGTVGSRGGTAQTLTKGNGKNGSGGMTAAERQRMLAGVGDMMAETNASMRQAQNRMAYAKANAGLKVSRVAVGERNTGMELGQNGKVVATKPQYDAASGEMKQTYVTESGNEYDNRAAADLEQNATDQYKDSMSVSGQLREAYAERDRLDEALKKRAKEIDDRPGQGFSDFVREMAAGSTAAGPLAVHDTRRAKYEDDDEYLQLMAAARKNHQTIQLLEDKKNGKMNSFWHSLGTTATNGYTFNDGMSEMRDARAQQKAEEHIDSINRKRAEGKPLTKEEKTAEAVLKNFATDDAVQGMYGGDYGAWARAGGMMANSVDFMKDLWLNPGALGMAKGVMRGTAKGLVKGLAKVTGEEAARLWKNNVVRRTLKATGMLIGAHTAGAYVSNTTGIGRTAAAMGTLTSGNATVDEKGNYKVENAMGLLPAFIEAERQQTRENGSEMFGEFIPGVGGMVKKGLGKIGLSKLTGAMTSLGNKTWYKQYSRLLEAGGYNGLPGEALEEYEGSLFDALTGHAGDAWDDMTSLQNHVDIWLGCATMGALLGAVPMMAQGYHTAQYYRYKHNADNADKVAGYRMTNERWEPLRERIDGTDNGNMAVVVTDILNDNSMHVEEKKAALNYVRNLSMMRGYNIAAANNADDSEEQSEEAQGVNDSYSEGYETTDPGSVSDAWIDLNKKRERVQEELGMESEADVDAEIGDDPLGYIEDMRKRGNTEGIDAVIAYANAKSAYDGMAQRVYDDIDSRVEEINATIDSHMNRGDGMTHPASLKEKNEDGTDKAVYVVSGSVVMLDDGTGVDSEKSDKEIVVRDATTGEMRMIPATDVHAMGETIDPEEERAAARDSIVEEMSARLDAMEGTVEQDETEGGSWEDETTQGEATETYTVPGVNAMPEYGVNDTFTLRDAEGNAVSGEVQGISEDGVEIRTDTPLNGEYVQVIPAEEFESMVESINDAVTASPLTPPPPRGGDDVVKPYPLQGTETQSGEEGESSSTDGAGTVGTMGTAGSIGGEQTEPGMGEGQTALARVPKDEQGQPVYEQAEADDAWDAIVEQTGGDNAMARSVVDSMVADKKAALRKAEAAETRHGDTVQEKIAAERDRQTAIDKAKAELSHWEEIAAVEQGRNENGGPETEVRNGDRRQNGSEKAIADKITPVGESDFGFVYDQFKGNAQGAIQQLMKMQDGEALGALHHAEIGDIDLVWGKAGTKKSDGYGLAKLVKFHPEVLGNLQGILDSMHVTRRSENRVQLENDEYQAAVRLTWNGDEKLWLLTAFKKKETSEPTNSRTDVDSNLDGKSDDTATRQSSDVSVGKVIDNQSDLQGNVEKTEVSGRYDKEAIPTDKSGEPLYERVPKARTVEDLFGKLGDGGLAKAFALQKVAEAGYGAADLRGFVGMQAKAETGTLTKEKKALQERVLGWLTDDNIEWAEGKDLKDVIAHFGNTPEPIAVMPSIVRKNVPSIDGDYLYCGKAYMIDHQANHHPELGIDEYINIQTILDSYDDIKDLSEGGSLKLAFIKKLDKGYAVVVELSKENGKIILHKTFFYRDAQGKRVPYKNKPSILKKWSEDGSTSISPAENQQPADTDNISALDHFSESEIKENRSNSQENSEKTVEKEGAAPLSEKIAEASAGVKKDVGTIGSMGSLGTRGLVGGEQETRTAPAQTDADEDGKSLAKRKATAYERARKRAERQREARRRKKAEAEKGYDMEPHTPTELAASLLGGGGIKLQRASFLKHTGYGNAEAKKYLGILASREKGGMTMEEAGEQVLLADEENQWNLLDHGDANAGLDALLDALHECRTKGELQKYILTNRIREREGEEEAERAREEAERDDYYYWQYHMSYDDYMIYEEELLPLYIEEENRVPEEVRVANLEESVKIRKYYENNGRETGGRGAVREKGSGEQGRDEGGGQGGSDTPDGEMPSSRGSVLEGPSRGEAQGYDEGLSEAADGGKPSVREQKAAGAVPVSHNERVLRDAVDERLREAGMDVIGDAEEGQRVLDMANGADVRFSAKKRRALETAEQSQKTTIATAVSSADGAKVLNNLDTLANNLEKTSSHRKTFIGDVAKAFGSDNRGKSSKYATFETKNGEVVTIRISDHNARVSNFDAVGEDNGISVVVTRKPNKGITNDGNAHIVEFFYPEIALQRAEGKPLAEIVKSIKQVLYSGEFKDTTGLAERQEVNADEVARQQKVYHGGGAGRIRFFRTANGEAYGFTVGGKIYYDPRIATSETLVHEYAHLWASALRAGNAEEWKNVVGLMKGTSVWEDVKRRYSELKTDDDIADEVLAQYSGRRGAERLREEARKIAEGNGGVLEKAEAISALEKVKKALSAFWKGVCDMLHIHFTSAEEVADRVMKDLLDGVDPRKFGNGDGLRLQEDAETAEIVANAKADGTYMKAPNGEPSKLSPRQWVQVRTKAFREWFGDWEKAARIEKLRRSEPVEITGKEIAPSEDLKEYKKNALEYGKSLRGAYTNEDTGEVIDLTGGNKRGGIREILQHDYKDREHLQSIAAIPQIIEKSVFVDELPNEDKQHYPDVKSFRYYVCGLKIGGTDYTVKAVVAEQNNGNRYYDHRLTDIEKGKLLSIVPTIQKAGIDGSLPNSAYKDKRLFSILQTNSSKVVDENGEPRVVYHQTNSTVWINRETGENYEDLNWQDKYYWQNEASQEEWEDAWEEQDFYTFDNTSHGRRSVEMPAFFFAPEYDEYHEYGDRTIAAFLNIKNPAINPDIENRGVYDDAGEKAMQKLIGQGYDGFIREDDGEIYEINAFYPNQIKSAEENVGTFDANNNDIRYQFVGERGAEAADRAEEVTTRLDNLSIARSMEGAKKDAKAIKMATGWERGADGKWRYEIPDAKIKDTADIGGGHIVKRYEEDMLWTDGKLGKVVDAPELFKAYPELKDIRLSTDAIMNDMPSNGEYNHGTKAITIHADELKYLNSILNHEIQHAIQHAEGFARGGNEASVEAEFKAAKAEWKARAYAHELEETAKELGGEYNQAEVEKALVKEYEDMGIQDYLPDNETRIKGFNYFARGYADRSMDDAIKRFRLETSTRGDFNAYSEYRKLSGEVEARNVQTRLDMTYEERRASLAAETEDVAREDQIFLFGDGGTAHMGSRTDKRMAEIGEHFEGKELNEEQRAVVDVFSGKRDRQTVTFTGKDGNEHKMLFVQGNEMKAGTKHAVYRHYNTNEGMFDADEIKKVHETLSSGERSEKAGKIEYVYTDKNNGVEYTVAAEKKGGKERFVSFYTNRKAPNSGMQNTQLSAQANLSDASDAAKVARKSETASGAGENVADEAANERFNSELTRYQNGEMDKNEMLHLGRPQGVMRAFLPNLPIVMRQRVIKKGSEKKHKVDVSAIRDMPQHLSSPIFVFQRSEDTIGVLTDMRDRNGKNVCVAIELKRQMQQGAEYLEVNDVRSFHGREFKNIVEPIANNKTLKWVDKEKGLAYLSSASQPVQQEIDKQVLETAAKVVKDFTNPNISVENISDEGMKFRLLEDDNPKAMELESLPESELMPVYRNVQAFEDDALGSPMAFTDAETGERRTLQGGKWNASAQEDLELTPEQQRQLDELNKNGYIVVDGKKTNELKINNSLFFKKGKTGDAQLQYWLKKNPEDSGVPAAYDPYDHAIEIPLNTQFGTAYKRPNLVVVRSLIPKSEIDEPYHAKYALLPTGAHDWNNGRTLYLSRWSKIDKVLTREEEAKLIDEYWKNNPGKREALKSHRDYNRFVPQVRRELEKMGYRFELDGRELTPEESLALDEQNWENRDVIPGIEGHIPFISNDDIARINAKMSGKWVGEPKEAMNNAMAARVNELAESLNTPVRIVRTDEEVAALPSARQRRMKGSFNPLTGEVTIVVPNNANLADVENTFVHEVVGHDGLRVLFPEKEKLDNALDELYRVSNTGIQQTIDRMAQKMYDAEVDRLREKKRKAHEAKGEDSNASYYADMAEAHVEASKKREQFRRDATEEYGADLAGRIGESDFEKMSAEEQTFWGKLKSMLQKALQKLLEGLKIPGKKKWSDKEWAFVLHEAYKRKKNGGRPTVFDAADTEVMRRKTGFGETKFSEGKSNDPKPIGRSIFGSVYNQFKGKVVQAVKFLANHESGDLLGVFHRKDIGDIDMVWGDEGGGLCHILYKHVNDKDFPTVKDLVSRLEDIIANGKVDDKHSNVDKLVLAKDGYLVTIRRNMRDKGKKIADKNWVLTAYNKDAPATTKAPADGTYGSTAVAPGTSSDAKVATLSEINKLSDNDVADNGIKFRDGDSVEYNRAMARDTYERRVIRGMYQTQEALQDSMLGLKEAMDAILKAEGKGKTYIEEVAGYENAYLGENRLSSTNQAECAEFARRLFKPMLEEVAKLAKTADERAELTDYMMAKHGLERNEVMARRAAEKKANEEFGADIRKAERAVNQNPLDQDAIDRLDDLRQQRDDREQELYLENRGKDYSGLTALTGMDNVVDAEIEARAMVSVYEMDHDTTDLWDKVNAVNKATLQKTYESGLINKATYDDIKGMYTHYIPLRGFDDKTSDEAYAYLADKHSAFNAPIKTAKGRKSKADDPFANMEAMAESAIMQGNRNTLVKQKFLNFALNHPSDLVSVSDLWLRYDDVRDEWIPVNTGDIAGTEALNEDDSAAEVERKMRDFEEAMKQAAKKDGSHFKRQKDAPDIPYRVVESRDLRQHQVLVKRGGKDYLLTINGNPRAAQALNGQTNPDNDVSGAIGAIMHLGESVNRQLSAFYTTRNPDFVVSNFMRDMLYSNSMVWVKESPNYAWRYNWNVAKVNPAKMKILLSKLRNGELDMTDKTEKMFKLFIDNGGETGYSNIRDIEQRKNDIKREVKKMNGKLPIHQAWDLLSERLDDYSRAVELCARFAAFKTSREMGRTIDRSIYDAKEISVNFNKKGSGAKFMGAEGQTKAGNAAAMVSGLGRSFYVFWNAGMQGTTNFGRQAKRHPKKAIAGVAAMFMLGALMAHFGSGDGGDDGDRNDYYNLPEYVRRSNIVFRLPGMDKSWIALPLPVEYRAMYGMGELAVSVMSGKEHYTGGELAHAMASQVSQVMPLDLLEGGGGFKPFVPSAVKPFAEVLTNESWTGMPIYKDTPYNKNDPEWTKAYKSANPYLVGMSKWLNERTGGDRYTKGKVDINPAKVEYLLNGYFGGLSRSVDELVKMGETATGGMEYDPKNMMFMNRVIKRGDERTEYRAVNEEYWKIREESEALRKRLNHYEMDTADGVFDYAEKIAWLNNSPEYRVLETYEKYSGDVTGWSEALAYATRKGYTNRANEANEMLNEAKARLVHEVEKARAGKR